MLKLQWFNRKPFWIIITIMIVVFSWRTVIWNRLGAIYNGDKWFNTNSYKDFVSKQVLICSKMSLNLTGLNKVFIWLLILNFRGLSLNYLMDLSYFHSVLKSGNDCAIYQSTELWLQMNVQNCAWWEGRTHIRLLTFKACIRRVCVCVYVWIWTHTQVCHKSQLYSKPVASQLFLNIIIFFFFF